MRCWFDRRLHSSWAYDGDFATVLMDIFDVRGIGFCS